MEYIIRTEKFINILAEKLEGMKECEIPRLE
jgi:hypothetical protein